MTKRKVSSSYLFVLNIVRGLSGVGDTLAPRLIGEIGDIRRFDSAKALIAYAGIDAPPYQSGKYNGTERHISKRGSSNLRKIAFETVTCVNTLKRENDPVFLLCRKKEKKENPLK